MSRSLFLAMLCAWMCFASAAQAKPAEQALQDAGQEARARQLFTELRCMVCQGQSVADSQSEVASDIRVAVRQMIAEGRTAADIKNFLVSRYGEVILMAPRLNARTWLLWLAPMMIGLIGICVVFAYFGASRLPKR